jgi:uncharacterized protein (DUF433 family)
MAVLTVTEIVPIETDDDGVIHVSKTRVTLDTLVAAFKDGATPEEIAQQYPSVSLADVYSIIGYSLRRSADVEAYLAKRGEYAGRVRTENEARFSPPGARERLALRGGLQKSLRQSIQSVKEGAATYAAEDVAKKLGLSYISERITVNPDQCGGRPCIRGMRIRVVDVLDLLASGLSAAEVLQELPDLEAADILAVMKFSARRLDHPILAVA